MKLTAAIAGSYPNAKVTMSGYDDPIFKIDEIDFKHDEFTLMRVSNGDIFHEPIDQCQLILTPLSKISDEDAFRCASMCGLHTAGNRVIRITAAVFVENDTYQLQISHNGYVCLRKNGALYNMDIRKVYDYLRSKGYDCGHGSIPSLIAAGVAVEPTH